MNKLKETVIAAALNHNDKVYIHALPHEDLAIGARGLIGNEKTAGIVLALSSASSRDLCMEENGIFVKLRFAGLWEDVFIPYAAVDAALDDLSEPSFIFNFPKREDIIKPGVDAPKETKIKKKTAKIVKPDFTKNRK